MYLQKNRILRGFLPEHGCINPDTPCLLTHLCPHYIPPHAVFEPIVREAGFSVAWDGMSIML